VTERHPLLTLLLEAAAGRFPPPDGTVEVLPSPPGPSDAVVAFTAHSVVASPFGPEELLPRLDPDDLGAATRAEFLAWLAGRLGTRAGMHDMVFVAPHPDAGEESPALVPRDDLLDHPRLERSRLYRRDLRCYSDPDDRALVVVGRGLAGRWEMGLEIKPEHREMGLGRSLARAGARLGPDGEPLFAQVTPGNARSVRAFLAAGYRPIGSEVVFLKRS
jgi:FR47-like protein